MPLLFVGATFFFPPPPSGRTPRWPKCSVVFPVTLVSPSRFCSRHPVFHFPIYLVHLSIFEFHPMCAEIEPSPPTPVAAPSPPDSAVASEPSPSSSLPSPSRVAFYLVLPSPSPVRRPLPSPPCNPSPLPPSSSPWAIAAEPHRHIRVTFFTVAC